MIKSSKDLCITSDSALWRRHVTCYCIWCFDSETYQTSYLTHALRATPPPPPPLPGLGWCSLLSRHCTGSEFKRRCAGTSSEWHPGYPEGPGEGGRGFHYISVPRSHFIWTSAALLGLPEGDGDVGLCEGRGGCYVRPLVWLEIESFQSLFVTRLRSRGAHKHSSVHCVLSYRSAPPCRSATLIVLLWRWFSLIQRSESPNISLFLPPSIRWALQLTITFISDPTAVLSVNL